MPVSMMFTVAALLPAQQRALDSLVNAQLFFPVALTILGVLLLLYGFRAYQAVVIFNCIALGFFVGWLLGEQAQIATVAAVVGAVVLGAISWPLMKFAVSLCGGLVGAIVGMVLWNYFNLPPETTWAGGLCGLVVLGMLSFVLFKTSIIVFSSIQGAAMLVLGAAAVLMRYQPWRTDIAANLGKPILMPLLVFSIALLGLIYQQQKHGLLDTGKGGDKKE